MGKWTLLLMVSAYLLLGVTLTLVAVPTSWDGLTRRRRLSPNGLDRPGEAG